MDEILVFFLLDYVKLLILEQDIWTLDHQVFFFWWEFQMDITFQNNNKLILKKY